MDDPDSNVELVGGPFAVIESDPGVFTTLIRKLGTRGLEVAEIYDIEPWATDHLTPHGLIFCYMCADNEDSGALEDIDDSDAERVWFANQLSDDACASHAILNVLLNCPNVDLGQELREFQAVTEGMSPMIRGLAVSSSTFIRNAHNSLARPADIRGALQAIAHSTLEAERSKAKAANGPPTKRRKTAKTTAKSKNRSAQNTDDHNEQYHFIGYVPAHGKVWELDGLRCTAVEVGEFQLSDGPSNSTSSSNSGWMDIVRPALRMRMRQHMTSGNDHVRYNLLAIVDEKYLSVSDELEMLKRECNALERRLHEAYPEGWANKVVPQLLAGASETFVTSLRSSSDGRVFSQDFGARKMGKEIAILDMAVRHLPAAWNACMEAALRAKISVEEEIAKAKDIEADHIKRTFDYEPFVTQFITCMHNEGLLEATMNGSPAKEDDSEETPSTPAKRGRKPKPNS